jgi:4,5-DOPA dioxygenase extradiol
VLQRSVQTHLGTAHPYKLGRARRALTEDGVLILASGSFSHDLRGVDWRGGNAAPGWVTEFADWVNAALAEGRIEDMLNYRRLAQHAARNHSTQEHFLPLFVALGAGGTEATSLEQSLMFSALKIDASDFAT